MVNRAGQGVTWSLPAAPTEPIKQELVPGTPAVAKEVKSVENIVGEIPSFTERCVTTEAVPPVQVISLEIRRTKTSWSS